MLRTPHAPKAAIEAAEREIGITMARLRTIDRELDDVALAAGERDAMSLEVDAAMACQAIWRIGARICARAEGRSAVDIDHETQKALADEARLKGVA